MAVQCLVLMGVIYILLKIISDGLAISVLVIIIGVLSMTKISHPCCLHLEDSATALLMADSASTIM